MKIQKRAGCIGLYKNKLLFVQNLRGEIVLIKGHLEENEIEEDAALREFKEESGYIDIVMPIKKIDDLTYTRGGGAGAEKFTIAVYLARLNSLKQEPKVTEDGLKLKNVWVDIGSVDSVISHKNLLPIIEKIRSIN